MIIRRSGFDFFPIYGLKVMSPSVQGPMMTVSSLSSQ